VDQQEFEDHPLWTSVSNVLDVLDDSEGSATGAEVGDRERIRFVAALARSFREVDSVYFVPTMLDQVNQGWVAAHNQIVNNPNNPASVEAARTQAEATMVQMGSWPQPVAKGGAAAKANRIFEEYRDVAGEAAERLRERVAGLTAELDRTRAEHEEAAAETEAALAALRKQVDGQAARITADEARLDKALTDSNEAFRTAQNERDEAYRGWLKTQGEALEELAHPRLAQLTEMRDEAKKHLAELADLHDRVEKLAGKATGAVLARGYGQYSFREWISGVIAYVLGFAVLGAVGLFLFSVVQRVAADQEVTWQFVALRLGVTLTGAAAAGVAFSLGAKFLHRANVNKRIELELRAIGTFLEDVDDLGAVRQAKLDFVNRMFGRAWEDSRPKEAAENLNTNALGSAVDSLLKLKAGLGAGG
jgi:hypothetical protein